MVSASAITVVGDVGDRLEPPETFDVSPVKTHRPSSWAGVSEKSRCAGSRTPANDHCVFHHANLR